MKNFTLICFIAFAFTCISAHAQQIFKTTPTSVIGFLEYLPQDYHDNSNKYPIVIFLHGIGERGPNSTDASILEAGITTITKHGPPKHVKYGTEFPFILISPQLKNNFGNWPTWYVMELINYCKTYLRIDERRIYITGMSLGGGGTWTMAQDFAKLFAAIAPVCGGYNAPSKACQIAGENLPVWAFHGDADTVVPLGRSTNMVKAINACLPTPNPEALMTIYPGVKHNAWDKAYAPDHSSHNPNVYEWMMSYTNTTNAGNKIPMADAGADVTITSTVTTLTGSGTDADGTIAAYNWTQLSGPKATLTNAATKSLSVANLVTGEYVFRLTVKDNSGNTDSDYKSVTVQTTGVNTEPVAYAGKDMVIEQPASSATITGKGTDADGSIASYVWTRVSGPSTVTLANANAPQVTVSGLAETGMYVFQLTVKDDKGAVAFDKMAVTVKASTAVTVPSNELPVADAGTDVVLTLPQNTITLNGAGTDLDGTIVSYAWSKVSGEDALLSGTETSALSASNLVAGQYTFRLTVKDDKGGTATDDVILTVKPAEVTNMAPVAYAGRDMFLPYPDNSAVVQGSGSDADGTIVSYAWVQVSGPARATLNGANTPTLQASNLIVAGFYVFKLTVKDNNGVTDFDKMGITVNTSTLVQASFFNDPNVEQVQGEEGEVSLDRADDAFWKEKSVVVYNELGRRIYAGDWSPVTYREVFQSGGLYVYTILSAGKRIKTGKIFVTQ